MNEGDPQERIPTVKVKSGDSYAVINASDFVEGEHELFVEDEGGGSGSGAGDKRAEYEDMNKDALKSLLDAREVKYESKDTKEELIVLLLAKDISDAEAAE